MSFEERGVRLSKPALQIFEYLIRHIESGKVRAGQPQSYVAYSEVHNALGFDQIANTVGKSLDRHGMGELARWIKESNLPAITGLIISKSDQYERRYQPGAGYFEMYERPDLDYKWWQEQIQLSLQTEWRKIIEPFKVGINYPDEVSEELHIEGAKKVVTVNAYERNSEARQKCIDHWGLDCQVCGVNFSKRYGDELGAGFIHVHHIKPLSEIGKEYEVDPIHDLIPLCPNCHTMVHRLAQADVSELKRRFALNNKIST